MGRFFSVVKKNFNHELSIIRLYALLYLVGGAVGAIAAILLRDDFSEQVRYLFSADPNSSIMALYIQQVLFFLLLFFMGLTVVGVPLLPLFPLYKGFSLGFLISLSIILSGVRGLIFGTLAFFVQNAFYTFLGYFLCYSSAQLSVALFVSLKGACKHGAYYREFKRHLICLLLVVPLLSLGALWEFYVVPFVMKLI